MGLHGEKFMPAFPIYKNAFQYKTDLQLAFFCMQGKTCRRATEPDFIPLVPLLVLYLGFHIMAALIL